MRKHDAGFTLGEVLIATALTLTVLATAMTMFTRSIEISDTARLVGDTNHAMQATMSIMVRDFIQAGQGIPKGGVPVPTGDPSLPIIRPAPVGTSLTLATSAVTLPAVWTGGGLGPTIGGVVTDLAAIIYTDPTIQFGNSLAAIAADGSTMTVANGINIGGPDGVRAGDLILFSNALGSAIQMVSEVNGQVVTFATNDALRFNQRTAPLGTVMQLQSDPGVYPLTRATRIVMVSYYLDSTTDPNLPRLVRQVNAGTRLAIGLGVENLQFSYDLVDGTTNPSNIETPVSPLTANHIRKVNIFLSARSLSKALPSNQFIRNSMATSVGLRSLSFVDRYK